MRTRRVEFEVKSGSLYALMFEYFRESPPHPRYGLNNKNFVLKKNHAQEKKNLRIQKYVSVLNNL